MLAPSRISGHSVQSPPQLVGMHSDSLAAGVSTPGCLLGLSHVQYLNWHNQRDVTIAGAASIPAAAQLPAEPSVVSECAAMKAALLARIAALRLPPNFLDHLIDELGGPKAVAEMTGRRGRVVRDSRGQGMFELRAKPDSSEMDSLNVKEAGVSSHLEAATPVLM